MKKTIVMLGVGSTYFTKGIVESLIRKGGEWDLRLVDIDQDCLEIAMLLSRKMIEMYDAPITLAGSTERQEVLAGADAVVSTIGVGGRKAWAKDMLMFRDLGVYHETGDTYGPGGISRALRTVPALIDIAKDMERLCPKALLVNFSNPMTVNCWALNQETKINTIGLCYGITYFQHELAKFIEVPFEDTWAKAFGANHFSWITDFHYKGEDAFPLIREKIKEKGGAPGGRFTTELFETFDAFPCVGDGHICEFIPGFMKKEAYYGQTIGVDGIFNVENYLKHWDDVFENMKDQAYGRKPVEKIPEFFEGNTFKDEDLFIDVLFAYMGGKPVERTINLPNNGQIPGLPLGAVIESTTLVNSSGFHPLSYTSVPKGINAILQRILSVQELTVEAALKADRKLVVQTLMADMTVLTKAEAEKITDRILETHKEYLPQFYR